MELMERIVRLISSSVTVERLDFFRPFHFLRAWPLVDNLNFGVYNLLRLGWLKEPHGGFL